VSTPNDVPRVVSDLPARLDDLAPVFQRRRIAAGVDGQGRIVLARPDTIQVDFGGNDDRKAAVLDLVEQLDADNTDVVERNDAGATGVLTVAVPTATTEIDGEERWPLAALNSHLALFSGHGVAANLSHVIFGAHSAIPGVVGGASNGSPLAGSAAKILRTPEDRAVVLSTAEPAAVPAFLHEPLELQGHRRPRVLVLDTGLSTEKLATRPPSRRPENAALRASALGQSLHINVHDAWESNPAVGARDDEDEPDDDNTGTLDFEAGHGTFITGIVRQICPDAEIYPAGVLSSFGEGDTARVLSTIHRLTKACGPFDVLIMSFGGYFTNDDPGLFGIRLRSLLGDAIGIAAAGNMRSCRPYFPAAVQGIIGVGALDSGGRAWFSNFGSWVDACAPAVNVVSTFFNDFTETIATTSRRRYKEWAQWSGTSFAGPKVAGAIAQEMYLNQITAQEAWRRLSSHTQFRLPDLGVVFNV
jgi:subtilisin family serine protease